jgi:PleD family two-component response regulator
MTDASTLVTLSLGGTSLSAENVGVELLIGCADQALYQAKHNGRNQVRLWTDPLPAPSPTAPERWSA